MIERLPDWLLPNMKPSFNDLESATAIEMVCKLYGKNQELIDDYIKFVNDIKNEIKSFKESTNQDKECFEKKINKLCEDYIKTIDKKIKCQDTKVDDAIKFMKDNLVNTIKNLNENGELDGMILESLSNIERELTLKQKDYEQSLNTRQTSYQKKIDSQVRSLASGSPLVASSVSQMTDTNRVYVNTTDGKWYYHNGSSWVAGGTYQATEDSETVDRLKFNFDSSEYESLNNEIRKKIVIGKYNNDGTNIFFEENHTRLITSEILSFPYPIKIMCNNGYQVAPTLMKTKKFSMAEVQQNPGWITESNYKINAGANWYITIRKEDDSIITLEDIENIYFLPLENTEKRDNDKKEIYETILEKNIIDQYIKKCFGYKRLINYVYEDSDLYLQIPEPLIFDKAIKIKVKDENYQIAVVSWKSTEVSEQNLKGNTGWVSEYTIPKNTYFTIHFANVDFTIPVVKTELESLEISFVETPDFVTENEIMKLITKNGYLSKGFNLKNKVTQKFIPNYVELDSEYGFIGRWFNKTINNSVYKVTTNQGSEIHFKVKGTTTINVNWYAMTTGVAYFSYSIDGGEVTRQLITNPLIQLPDTEEHIIRVITDGITERIGKWENENGFAFAGVDVGEGEIVGLMPINKLIAFYGDSITEGIRALGIVEEGGDMGETNSSTNSFPYFCTQKLNAIPYFVGYGASGITVDGSFKKCITAIDNFSATRESDIIYPDLIVINHGTNDSPSSDNDFKIGYDNVLKKLHVKYPGVKIVCVIPFGQAKAKIIRECVEGKEYCHLVETNNWGVTYTSDSTHPDSAGAKIAGEKLAEEIETLI